MTLVAGADITICDAPPAYGSGWCARCERLKPARYAIKSLYLCSLCLIEHLGKHTGTERQLVYRLPIMEELC